MDNNSFEFMKDAFAAPLGDFIASIGKGVGEAQAALDRGSLQQVLEIYNGDPENSDEVLQMLREIGYTPTFYVLPKTTAKAKLTLAISQKNIQNNDGRKRFSPSMYATPVNAANANTYNLDLNASAEIQFDIVPVPPSDSSMIRTMPIISEEGKGENYFTAQKVVQLLDNYSINYEWESEVETIEDVRIIGIKIESDRVVLDEGKTIILPNDVLLISTETI